MALEHGFSSGHFVSNPVKFLTYSGLGTVYGGETVYYIDPRQQHDVGCSVAESSLVQELISKRSELSVAVLARKVEALRTDNSIAGVIAKSMVAADPNLVDGSQKTPEQQVVEKILADPLSIKQIGGILYELRQIKPRITTENITYNQLVDLAQACITAGKPLEFLDERSAEEKMNLATIGDFLHFEKYPAEVNAHASVNNSFLTDLLPEKVTILRGVKLALSISFPRANLNSLAKTILENRKDWVDALKSIGFLLEGEAEKSFDKNREVFVKGDIRDLHVELSPSEKEGLTEDCLSKFAPSFNGVTDYLKGNLRLSRKTYEDRFKPLTFDKVTF